MNDTNNASPGGDLIDRVVGLTPDDTLHAMRHVREKVAVATQGSYELFFDPAASGLTIHERLLVAYQACVLSAAPGLERHYLDMLRQYDVDAAILDAVARNRLENLQPGRLPALLAFTAKLILKPIEGDRAAVQALQSAGIATPDIITLAQLIAFLSYQVRLVAGLQAMKALGSQS
ncbi:CMD domain protein [Pollutimonas nitritireducens]|uniref:CMD domain protein n=1 Tax=Pollutimonas nitritireducens TaxID=2045209 RepID=A0A2N4UHS1_9BURK|nr:CMD domain protein [Pollutimonas nitritireducens]PLC54569.1 CMD domain protein [Pollutimonas nitritireducens]